MCNSLEYSETYKSMLPGARIKSNAFVQGISAQNVLGIIMKIRGGMINFGRKIRIRHNSGTK